MQWDRRTQYFNGMTTNDSNRMTVDCDRTHLWTVYDKALERMRVVPMSEMLDKGLDNWLIPLENGKWGRITDSRMKKGEPVQCILVDDDTHAYKLAAGPITHNTGGGKSVLQRNVVFHVIAHSRQMKFFGIDLKQVELSAFTKYKPVLYIATNLEDAVQVLTFAQDMMNSRYSKMKDNHANNFLDLDNPGPALLVMVDEAGELLDCSSPAKALASDTPMQTQEHGMTTLGAISIGDHVLGTDMEWHEVVNKYNPESQEHYRVTARRLSDGSTESFIAGSEHLWRVWVPSTLVDRISGIIEHSVGESIERHDDGSLSAVMRTSSLRTLKDSIDESEWGSVRLRREAIAEH